MTNLTRVIDLGNDRDKEIQELIEKVHEALVEKGYNPISQFVGYIMSGDPTYITGHKGARSLIVKFERDEILEVILKKYLGEEVKSEHNE
ncbi:MAG: IreB family regulatory phosphoprotein [Clostridia bacterium]|nr:IreB family regulatory phosphoprotein [Clostridia bacterium]